MSFCLVNHETEKYVEYLILEPFLWSLGPLYTVLSETQIYNKVLLIKFPDIFPSALPWDWVIQFNELKKLLISKACFSVL